jgi:Ca2+-binding RTX toxin-like protein
VQAAGTAPFDVFTPELIISAGHGDDDVTVTGNTAPLAELLVDGGSGDDVLTGSNADELFLAGPGDDFVDGNQGRDLAFLGGGDDVFQWDPGDGSDIVEGDRGFDTMTFSGSNASEVMELSAVGPFVRFVRNIGNIVMDLDNVERLDLLALGGTDTVTVGDMTGTDLTDADIDLGIAGAGDTVADRVIVDATDGDDRVKAEAVGGDVLVRGLAARTRIFDAEPTLDTLQINALAGFDVVTVADAVAALIQATVDLGTQ